MECCFHLTSRAPTYITPRERERLAVRVCVCFHCKRVIKQTAPARLFYYLKAVLLGSRFDERWLSRAAGLLNCGSRVYNNGLRSGSARMESWNRVCIYFPHIYTFTFSSLSLCEARRIALTTIVPQRAGNCTEVIAEEVHTQESLCPAT